MDEKIEYIPRTLEKFFLKATRQFPVMLVIGPRQIGKTTFLKHLAAEKQAYVTLDDPLIRALAKNDPALFLQRYKPPLLIDEIQYAPELLPYIKMTVDQEKKAGLFWLTGSQHFSVMKGVSESLAGRVGIVNLLGFSQRELEGHTHHAPFLPTAEIIAERSASRELLLTDVYHRIWKGSFPALYKKQAVDHNLFYSSYVQTYLQRDIRDLAQVGDENAFLRFLRACAARTGQMLNMVDLCRDAEINNATGKKWLSILTASGTAFLLEPFHTNIYKRMIKTPKLYFLDTGLAAWLTEWSTSQTLEQGAMSGAFFETWVLTEILKSYLHNGKAARLYYYRDKDKKEIDLLIYQDGTLYPLEAKKSAAPDKNSLKHFQALDNLKQPSVKIGPGCVLSFSTNQMPLTKSIQAVPVGYL